MYKSVKHMNVFLQNIYWYCIVRLSARLTRLLCDSLLTELPASLGLLHDGVELIHLMNHLCCICQGKRNFWRESHDR